MDVRSGEQRLEYQGRAEHRNSYDCNQRCRLRGDFGRFVPHALAPRVLRIFP